MKFGCIRGFNLTALRCARRLQQPEGTLSLKSLAANRFLDCKPIALVALAHGSATCGARSTADPRWSHLARFSCGCR